MKRRIAYLIIACIPLLALVIYINNIFAEIKLYNIDMQLKSDEALVHKLEARILERFSKSEQDVTFIATYLGQNLAEAGSLSISDSQATKNVMNNILPSFLNVNHAYQEISFLDKNGNETLVATNNKVPIKVPVNKASEDYFQGVIRHRAGEVYVSFDGNSVLIASPIYDRYCQDFYIWPHRSRSGDIVNFYPS